MTKPVTYECVECGREGRADQGPLEVKACGICGGYFCAGCLPDHEGLCAQAAGKQQAAEERFIGEE